MSPCTCLEDAELKQAVLETLAAWERWLETDEWEEGLGDLTTCLLALYPLVGREAPAEEEDEE